MRFDEKTKKVTISSNRGNLLISVEDVDGTAMTWQTLNGSFIQAVNQKEVPQYVAEGMSKVLTSGFNIYALNNDEELQTALSDLQVSFTKEGIEYGKKENRERINLTTPPPQHVEVRSDGKGNISFYIFYTPEQKKNDENDLLFILSKSGKISKKEFSRPEVQGEKFPLKDLISIVEDRGWMKDEDMVVDSETATLLKQIARKGYVLSDNYSKTNGFNILKNGKKIGEVTVTFNQDWEKDLRMILKNL